MAPVQPADDTPRNAFGNAEDIAPNVWSGSSTASSRSHVLDEVRLFLHYLFTLNPPHPSAKPSHPPSTSPPYSSRFLSKPTYFSILNLKHPGLPN